MVDRAGGTPNVGDFYLACGPVVKVNGTKITIAVGENGGKGGKPFTLDEGETFDVDTLLAAVAANVLHAARPHGLWVVASADETGTGLASATLLVNGKSFAECGDIVVPVACESGKVSAALWHSTVSAPEDWTVDLYKNGSLAASGDATFGTSETWSYESLDLDSLISFAAGDRFRLELGGPSDTADEVKAQISLILTPT